jgi:hypothetical protein
MQQSLTSATDLDGVACTRSATICVFFAATLADLLSIEDMVRRYIEKRSGTDSEKRWGQFAKLLSSPRLPSGLR